MCVQQPPSPKSDVSPDGAAIWILGEVPAVTRVNKPKGIPGKDRPSFMSNCVL